MSNVTVIVGGACATLFASLVTFYVARHVARRDIESQRITLIESRVEAIRNFNDRLGVMETAIQTTGERVNDLHRYYDQLVGELRDAGIDVERHWFRW